MRRGGARSGSERAPPGPCRSIGGDALDLSVVRFRPVHEVDVEGDDVALRGDAVLDPPGLLVVEARTGKRDAARADPAERRGMGRPADEAALLAPRRRRGWSRVQEAAGAGKEVAPSQHGKTSITDAELINFAGKYLGRQILRKRTETPGAEFGWRARLPNRHTGPARGGAGGFVRLSQTP